MLVKFCICVHILFCIKIELCFTCLVTLQLHFPLSHLGETVQSLVALVPLQHKIK